MKHLFRIGFTLIELLVTVAIIMVLAGILLPALFRARESGKSAKCANNLRQLQVATYNYISDKGGLPASASSWSYNRVDNSWTHQAGWIAFSNKPNGFVATAAAQTNTGYGWNGPGGVGSITNGILWPYINGNNTGVPKTDVYLCPTFDNVCGTNNAKRSYAMVVTGVNPNFFASQTVRCPLYADDARVSTSPCDGVMAWTNDLGRWHVGRGNVVYLDGHIDKL